MPEKSHSARTTNRVRTTAAAKLTSTRTTSMGQNNKALSVLIRKDTISAKYRCHRLTQQGLRGAPDIAQRSPCCGAPV